MGRRLSVFLSNRNWRRLVRRVVSEKETSISNNGEIIGREARYHSNMEMLSWGVFRRYVLIAVEKKSDIDALKYTGESRLWRCKCTKIFSRVEEESL